MDQTAFPFNTGTSHIERAHPHIVERLRLTWGYPEGGRYLARLIVDSRGGRAGFSQEVMSELLTLATLAADLHAPRERTGPYGQPFATLRPSNAAGGGFMRGHDQTLQPISFQLSKRVN